MSKTFVLKPADVKRNWVVIDASEAPLGRIATVAANRLIGKYQPTYTPHVDSGDHVIVINAGNLVVTGNKMEAKIYYSYSGFPGGLSEKQLKTVVAENPAFAVEAAIKGMLPKNKLQADRVARLKVYAGAEHKHEAQQPVKIGVKK
jgi:large subunit ribosomal protein L13